MNVVRLPFEISSDKLLISVNKLMDVKFAIKPLVFGINLDENLVYANCVTILRYLLLDCCEFLLPSAYIGNLPRLLINNYGAKIVERKNLQVGDLLFMKKKSKKRLLSHVAIVVSDTKVFNCRRNADVVIEDLKFLFEIYKPVSRNVLMHYIDIRSRSDKKKIFV